MARNELTSKRISTIAGRVLADLGKISAHDDESLCLSECCIAGPEICTVVELKALAASALTQAVDKPKHKRTKNIKKRSK